MKINFHILHLLVALCVTLLMACGADQDVSSLDKWVAARQLSGSELIEKIQYDKHYFALFRKGQKLILMQRITANESAIGGYSSYLSVDDDEGLNPNVANAKTNIDSSAVYKQDKKIFKERTISLEIDREYEGKLHIVYRWRPIVLVTDEGGSDAGMNQERMNMDDPVVFDVETFWVGAPA